VDPVHEPRDTRKRTGGRIELHQYWLKGKLESWLAADRPGSHHRQSPSHCQQRQSDGGGKVLPILAWWNS
jgi:hypothetical protein